MCERPGQWGGRAGHKGYLWRRGSSGEAGEKPGAPGRKTSPLKNYEKEKMEERQLQGGAGGRKTSQKKSYEKKKETICLYLWKENILMAERQLQGGAAEIKTSLRKNYEKSENTDQKRRQILKICLSAEPKIYWGRSAMEKCILSLLVKPTKLLV